MRKKKCEKRLLFFLLLLVLIIPFGCSRGERAKEETNIEDQKKEAEQIAESDELEENMSAAENEEQEAGHQVMRELKYKIQTSLAERQAYGEKWSVYVEDLDSGNYVAVWNVRMESASLIKLFTAAAVFDNMKRVQMQEAYAGETYELIGKMIRVSDNEAYNELVRRIGEGDAEAGKRRVNEFCEKGGYIQTHVGRLVWELNASDYNTTSTENCCRLLGCIYRNELEGSEIILGYMKDQERTGKIPAGLPEGVESANKTGELKDAEHDAAIVFDGDEDYVLCIMSEELIDSYAARNKIIELSDMIYQYMADN